MENNTLVAIVIRGDRFEPFFSDKGIRITSESMVDYSLNTVKSILGRNSIVS